MEYKYKIVSRDSTKIVDLIDLSRNLKMNSDIFSIESKEEVLLGIISHKSLVYLSSEFADYALQNYEKKRITEAETYTSLINKWIDDDTSVSASAYSAAYAAGVNREEEFIRQGNFILDYLKSDLYLFHLEK